MKNLQITLFIIASVIFSTQTIRHMHLYFYGTETSVLDQFEEFSEEKDRIQNDRSLESLVLDYEAGKAEVSKLEKGLDWSERQEVRVENESLFSRVEMLESEIRQREMRSRDLRDMVMFSVAGFLLVIGGYFLVKTGREWSGIAVVIAGFAELVWWTKPDFFGNWAFNEYGNLLVAKIVISFSALITLFLLFARSNQHLGSSEVADHAN